MAGSKIKFDLTGKRFDYFRVMCRDAEGRKDLWLCQCDCGEKFTARSSDIRASKTTSCGCQRAGGAMHRLNAKNRGGYNL